MYMNKVKERLIKFDLTDDLCDVIESLLYMLINYLDSGPTKPIE